MPPAGSHPADALREEIRDYYAQIAPSMMQNLVGRRLTVIRWPKGLKGPSFYQRHPYPERSGEPRGIQVFTPEDLLTWVRRGAFEWHVPLGRVPAPDRHDWAVFDLDPNPPAAWADCVRVARVLLALLKSVSFPFCLKTSGARGLHIYIPIEPTPSNEATAIIRQLCQVVESVRPDWCTTARRISDRGPRVYLDYLQNGHTRTMAGVFSVRGRFPLKVSTPIAEEELDVPPETWTMTEVIRQKGLRTSLFQRPGSVLNLGEAARAEGLITTSSITGGRD